MSLFDRLLAEQLKPSTKPSAPSNARFEEKRQKWLAEALVKVGPKPKPPPSPPPAPRRELTDAEVEEVLAPLHNPFVRPDVHALVGLGFGERVSKEGEKIVVQLLPSALDAIAKRWVRA